MPDAEHQPVYRESAFNTGIVDEAQRQAKTMALYDEVRIQNGMTTSEVISRELAEQYAIDFAVGPEANFDPRFETLTLEQREDLAFYYACSALVGSRQQGRSTR